MSNLSKRLKIVLGVLFAVALLAVVRLGIVFSKNIKSPAAILLSTPTPEPSKGDCWKTDSDNDGLFDCEEIVIGSDPLRSDTSGDGVLDGIRVGEGCSPLIPKDKGCLFEGDFETKGKTALAPNTNLTDQLIEYGLASVIDDSGDFNPDQITTEKFGDIINSIQQESTVYLSIPELTDSDIRIIDDNSPETVRKYLNSAAPIVEEVLMSAATPNAISKISDISFYQKSYDSLKSLDVPSSWKEIQKSALNNFALIMSSAKTISDLDNDPVKASYGISQIQDSFIQLSQLAQQAITLAQQQKITIDDSVISKIVNSNPDLLKTLNGSK